MRAGGAAARLRRLLAPLGLARGAAVAWAAHAALRLDPLPWAPSGLPAPAAALALAPLLLPRALRDRAGCGFVPGATLAGAGAYLLAVALAAPWRAAWGPALLGALLALAGAGMARAAVPVGDAEAREAPAVIGASSPAAGRTPP